MSVALRGAGSAATGSTSVAPIVPSSATTGDISILDVVVKPYSVSLPAITGWTKVADVASGTTASSASAGSVRVGRYIRASASASSAVSVSLSGANSALGVINTYYSTTGSLDWSQSTAGVDGTAGSAYSATGSSGIGVASGDTVVASFGQCAATLVSSPSLGGMSGATLGTQTARTATQNSSDGHFCGLYVYDRPVTAGSSSSAPTFTATGSATTQGGSVFTRLREVAETVADSTLKAGVGLAPVASSDRSAATAMGVGAGLAPVTAVDAAVGAALTYMSAGVGLAPVALADTAAQSTLKAGVGLAPVALAITECASGFGVGAGMAPVVGLAELPDPLDHRLLITTPEYRDALQSTTRQATGQVEFIDDSDAVVAVFGGTMAMGETLVPRTGVLSATIQDDANAEIRRSGSVDFADASLVPDTPDDLLHPLSRLRARVWHVMKVGALWQRVLMGTGHLSFQAQDSTTEFGIQCQLDDSFSVVRRAQWTRTLTVGGLPNHTALERIFQTAAPWLRCQITPTDFVLPPDYELGKPGSNPVADAKEIAVAAGLDLHIDRWGTIVAEPIDQQTQDDIGIFREGPGCHMRSLSRGISTDDLANVVLVMSSNNSLETPVSAMVEDTDPTSPTWVGYGRRYVRVVESDVVTTTAQCLALARSTLTQARALTETVQLEARSIPHLDARSSLIDVATNRSKAFGTYEVQALSFAIGEEAGMTVNCAPRRVSILDL